MANEYFIPSTIDAVLATSITDYAPYITDNVYNSNVLLGILNRKKLLINGGTSKTYPLIIDEQDNGGFFVGSAALNTEQTDTETLIEYRWQNIYEPVQINRDEERQNAGDEHKIISLMGEKIQRSELAIAKRAEQAFSTNTAGAGYIVDLENLVNTNTLGTVNGASETNWQSTVTTSGSFAAQGLTDMATAFYAVSSAETTDTPDVIITTKASFRYFENTKLPLERISDGNLSANAGFRNLTYKGVPVTYGNEIGSGLMFGLNMNYIDYCVDSETDFVMTPFLSPVNQMTKVAFILHRTTGPVTNNRRRHFQLSSISA